MCQTGNCVFGRVKINNPCRQSLCPNIAAPNSSYCLEHKRDKANKDQKRRVSNNWHEPFYQTKEWKAVRARKILLNPYCEEHLKFGVVIAGEEIDHIKPISKGGAKLDISNLQTLCKQCHSKKSYQENNRKFAERFETELNVVAGPPLSGKTEFVKVNFNTGNLVIDKTELAKCFANTDGYVSRQIAAVVGPAIEAVLREAINRVSCIWYMTEANTKSKIQEEVGIKPTNIFALNTPKSVCLSRLLDSDRPGQDEWRERIVAWYEGQDLYEMR